MRAKSAPSPSGSSQTPSSAKTATPDICVAPLASAGDGAVETTAINATTARVVSVKIVNRRFMILMSCSVNISLCFWASSLQQERSHPGGRTMLILDCIFRLLPPAFPGGLILAYQRYYGSCSGESEHL